MRLPATSDHDIRTRSRQFGLRIIRLAASLPGKSAAQIIARQIIRSATSVGAHLAEANRAKSENDFTNKLDGALQELDETVYWLEMIADAGFMERSRLLLLLEESEELISILVVMAEKTRRFVEESAQPRKSKRSQP